MKKNLSYITVVLGFCLCFSCTRIQEDFYPDGSLQSRIPYRLGKENGVATYYKKNRAFPYLEITMKNGKKEGKAIQYFFNGHIEMESFYLHDSLHGLETIYDKDGQKLSEVSYVHGKKDGIYRSWYANNVLHVDGRYKQDLFDGEWHIFDERGLLVGEGTFNMGKGQQITYDLNGNLKYMTTYDNNMKNGQEVHFTPKGDTLKVIFFQDDHIMSVRE
ncbi:MAG: toxin-antitoxin system YwqK family antitoxin [Bacteroidales bacterium]|jgi:antitoxin component YwqK of YwqJK toxin-antitoxin module|nr:toxin-antitoxin system YwqK family antitoxin [Bacteroidales bacterium]